MPAYTVLFSALTDCRAIIDVEADTPEAAAVAARALVDADDPVAAFELCDNGIDPIEGTIEPVHVDDADNNEVLTFPVVSGSDIHRLFAKTVAGLDDQELAIVLAGLRMVQRMGVHFPEEDIATGGGEFDALGDDGIDRLCERINTGAAA